MSHSRNPPAPDSLYGSVCRLPLSIDSVSLDLHEQKTASGWTRSATTISVHGGGCVGRGEDVNYNADEQRAFATAAPPAISGEYPSFSSFSRALDAVEPAFFPRTPAQPSSRLYRRWAFESAGLDLALRQAKTTLGEVLGRRPMPMRFVVSSGLGNPASIAPLTAKLATGNDLEFKIDYSEGFTDDLISRLRPFKIACIDFKGHYHGSFSGPPVDLRRYAAVASAFPHAILEDPGLEGLAVLDVLDGEANRLSWDYPIRSVADILLMPTTGYLNIKPSRFGLVSELLRALEFAQGRGLKLYGGGQFELGIGRAQAQEIAALFYADGPNDLAPSEYNRPGLFAGAPASPLSIPDGVGFGRSPL